MSFLTRIAFLTMKQVGIIAAILGFVFYKTMFDDGSELNGTIAQAQTELAEEQTRKAQTEKTLETRDKLQEILTRLTDKYEELSRQIPTDLNDNEVQRQLASLTQSARVRIVSRNPLEQIKGKVLVELPYELKLQGGYSEATQFINLVSNTERVMVVKSIRLEPNGEPYTGSVSIAIKLSAYKLASQESQKEEVRQ